MPPPELGLGAWPCRVADVDTAMPTVQHVPCQVSARLDSSAIGEAEALLLDHVVSGLADADCDLAWPLTQRD